MNIFKRLILRIFGAPLFLMGIGFYSFVLGPILMATLVPGGLLLLFLVLGWRRGVLTFIDCLKIDKAGEHIQSNCEQQALR